MTQNKPSNSFERPEVIERGDRVEVVLDVLWIDQPTSATRITIGQAFMDEAGENEERPKGLLD